MMKRQLKIWIPIILLIALAVWCKSRWKVWFGNPVEEAYSVSAVPSRVLLTFGDQGEMSRYVSWMCDTIIDPTAALLLTDTTTTDTTCIAAVGEVFHSRAGLAAYYRAEMTELQPNGCYRYAVTSNGQTSDWYQFSTSDPEAESYSFLYIGDVQDTIAGIANSLIKNALQANPEVEFIVFGGDLTERPTDRYWAETFRTLDSVCTAMPVVTILGNHEYLKYLIRQCERRNSLVFPYFLKGMDERQDDNHLFAFNYHGTEFFLLDTNRELPYLLQQRRWLTDRLSKSQTRHKIVIGHHPLYSVKKKNNNLMPRWTLSGPIEEAHVDLVLQGHEHAYARCTSSEKAMEGDICHNRPLYTISHCSPKNYKIRPSQRFSSVHSGSRYYQIITVQSDSIHMKAFDANSGEMIDQVTIVKN